MADVICRNIRGLIYSRNEILGENTAIEQEVDAMKCEVFSMSNSIEELSHEKCKLRQEIKQLDEEKCIYAEEARRREGMYNQKNCQVKHLCKENECLATRCKQLEKETCVTKQDLAAFENFLYELKKTAEEMDLAAETLVYQNKESKDVVSHLHSRVSQIKRCLRELSEDLESKCNCLDEVFQNLKHCESVRDQLECKGTEIRRQVLDLQTKLCNIQSKLQGERACNEKLQDKIAQGKCLLEDLQNSLEMYEREMEKIERRKEYHLKEILSVINEVKDDIKVQKSCFRKSTSREKPAKVSWSSSSEYLNKKPVEPKLSRSGMTAEMRNCCNPQKLLDLIKKNTNDLCKCIKPESNVFRKETISSEMRNRDEMNTNDREEVRDDFKQDYGRGKSTCRSERESSTDKQSNRPLTKGRHHDMDSSDKNECDTCTCRPKSMMDRLRSHSNLSRDNDTGTTRPKTIDITIRSTKETIKTKKPEGCKGSKVNKISCRNTGPDPRKKQNKRVDEIIRELLGSDIIDSNECRNETVNDMKPMKPTARAPTCMRYKK
uniref:Uncharacterized protein n=1 Tax=Cacopsylla melanoneura TaxID=428564 RepID=A0A8D9BQN0_9HEMI